MKLALAVVGAALLWALSVSSNGSTWVKLRNSSICSLMVSLTFSILERIDVGETRWPERHNPRSAPPFSILERIDVGETWRAALLLSDWLDFQYPRTDRRG